MTKREGSGDDLGQKTLADPITVPDQEPHPDSASTVSLDHQSESSSNSVEETLGPEPRYAAALETMGPDASVDSSIEEPPVHEVSRRSISTAEFARADLSEASLPTFFGASDTEEMVQAQDEIAKQEPMMGEVIGGYKLVSVLGRGGMSTVFLAKHQTLNRTAAIKVLAPELLTSQSHKARFFQEARLVNEVSHPNIVEIYDFVEEEEPKRIALVMEHLKGLTLSEALRRPKALKLPQVLRLCYQICDAVAAVHDRGVIHRDLKPDNIFLTASLKSKFDYVPSLKLLDFGIAKDLVDPEAYKTQTGIALGTPAYMAPEQISGAESTEKSDVYAVTSILYEMLTGYRLFSGDVKQILQDKLVLESPVLMGLDEFEKSTQISALITWGLTRDPKFRPTMENFTRGVMEIDPEICHTMQVSATSFFHPQTLLKVKSASGSEDLKKIPSETSLLRGAINQGKRLQLVLLLLGGFALLLAGVGAMKSQTSETRLNEVPISRDVSPPPKPVAMIGRIVRTEPAGALVINSQSREALGSTPVTLELNPGQEIRLELRKKGFVTEVLVINTKKSVKTIRLKTISRRTKPKLRRPKKAPKKIEAQPQPPKKTKAPYQRGEMPGWD